MNLHAIKRKHGRRLAGRYHGFVGVGVGEKVVGGKPTGETALVVYVQEKIASEALAADQRIDRDTGLLADLAGQPLDIKRIGKISAPRKVDLQSLGRVRPVQTGLSEGHFQITAGTGSVLVTRGTETFRLSNNHVYANSNIGKLGDPIYQPGPYDGGNPASVVGALADFVPLFLDGRKPNEVDCALRTTQADELPAIYGFGPGPQRVVAATLGMAVVKSGRTTDVTWGHISDVAIDLLVDYGPEGTCYFEDQILVEAGEAFSQGGDSGSAVLTEIPGGMGWVGLLFAGSDDGKSTICNHATAVAAALEIELVVADETGGDDGDDGDTPPVDPPSTGCLPAFLVGASLMLAVALVAWGLLL